MFWMMAMSGVVSTGEMTMCTADYNPVCAEKQVQCVTAPCNPVRQTYSNACMAAADQATVIFEGDCNIAEGGVIVGWDKDEHGCIGSAGYTWDEASQQCVRPWEQPAAMVTWAHDLGLTKYDNLADFNFDGFVTREQAAKMIMATIEAAGVEEWMIKQPEWSCVWTDADMIDSSLLPMVTQSCMKGLFKWSNGKFMPKAYLTDTDSLTVMTRAAQYIPALAEIMMRAKYASTNTPMTRGQLVTSLHSLYEQIMVPVQPQMDFAQAQKDLDSARALWNSKKLTTYSLIQTKSCFCMEDYTRAMMYNVLSGVINTGTLVYADDGTKVSIEANLHTVDQAFALIQDAIDNKVANVTVSYDTTYGYPTTIAIDVNAMMADEEQYYSFKLITDKDIALSWTYVLDTYQGTKVTNTGITLSFTPDRVSAKICNSINGTYTATSNSISFGPMMSTKMYCDDTQLMDLESKFGSLSSASYTTTTNTLTMVESGSTWVWTKKYNKSL